MIAPSGRRVISTSEGPKRNGILADVITPPSLKLGFLVQPCGNTLAERFSKKSFSL
jgi:hypothetical protein